jgi:hypothetical protein
MDKAAKTLQEYLRDPDFVIGGLVFLLSAFAILRLVSLIGYLWSEIIQFFTPITIPGDPPKKKPSPFGRLISCFLALIGLIVISALLVGLLYFWLVR